MPMFLCRWPNGEFSILSARNKSEAIIQLDEWGNAEQARLTRMDRCALDFRLNDRGEIELGEMSEATEDVVRRFCYPHLEEVLALAESAEVGYTEKGYEAIRKAVEEERTREWDNQPPGKQADTQLGREVQRRTGAASVVVNRAVREMARARLESEEEQSGKPN